MPRSSVPAAVTLALLFDLDGTLMDTLDAILAAMNAALKEMGEPPLSREELRPLIGMPVARQMAVLRGMDAETAAAVNDRYYVHFQQLVRKGVALYPGVREGLQALSPRPMTTVSTRRREVARLMLRTAGIESPFTVVVGGDEVSRSKPAPDLVLHAAHALGRSPAECVVVGDSPVDIAAGRAAGAWTVAVMYGYGSSAELQASGPHREVARFDGVLEAVASLEREAAKP